MLLLSSLLLLPLLQLARAAFIHSNNVCWHQNCILRTDAGTLCFEPHDNNIKHEECADNFLKNLTHIHLTSTIGRSILYYDKEARILGTATWTIPPSMAGSVFVCMTGRYVDDQKRYRTICRTAYGDDDMGVPAAHSRECVSDQIPRFVSDGCFSIGQPGGGDNDHKEWYEHPVVAGLFWVLGALVTLVSVYLWGGNTMQAVQARLPWHVVGQLRVARGWRRPVPPPPTQQPAIILEQI